MESQYLNGKITLIGEWLSIETNQSWWLQMVAKNTSCIEHQTFPSLWDLGQWIVGLPCHMFANFRWPHHPFLVQWASQSWVHCGQNMFFENSYLQKFPNMTLCVMVPKTLGWHQENMLKPFSKGSEGFRLYISCLPTLLNSNTAGFTVFNRSSGLKQHT